MASLLLLLGLVIPIDVEEDDDEMVDLSNSSLSSSKTFFTTSWSSLYLLRFACRSSGLSLLIHASCDRSSASMILFNTCVQRGKKRCPNSTIQGEQKQVRILKLLQIYIQ